MEKSLNRETLRAYWHHVKKYWSLTTTCVVGVLVVICLDIIQPIVFKHFFDLLAEGTSIQNKEALLRSAYWIVMVIAGIKAITFVSWRVIMWALAKFESRVMKDTTDSSFAHIQGHSARFFTDSFAGALVKRVNRFTTGLEVIADQIVMNLGQTVLRIVLVLGVLF